MKSIIEELPPTTEFQTANRHWTLSHVPPMSIRRLPAGSVVVFSMSHVYELAEQIRNAKGSAAIVLGALSPKCEISRLYLSPMCSAAGGHRRHWMGLNLDIGHVALPVCPSLTAAAQNARCGELAQIAGRAGVLPRMEPLG